MYNGVVDHQQGALIVAAHAKKKAHFMLTNSSFTYNVGPADVFVQLLNACSSSDVTFDNISIVRNSIVPTQFEVTTNEQHAIVYIHCGVFQIKNVLFLENIATPLALIDTHAHFMDTNAFLKNVAKYGRGIYFDSNTTVTPTQTQQLYL